ncbi:MAG: four-carbon acid sugar kinase family protein [Candidatus Cyclobacteriaceae bacterium M3_2C_046]
MLIVLADDFSGAAEMGGIGRQNGLSTSIGFSYDPECRTDILVIDTNTRGLNKTQAREKIKHLALSINTGEKEVWLFKKVDSVFRGHIITELNVLQQVFGFNRIFLMPANPSRQRQIEKGYYLIRGKPLHQTIFAKDPMYPVQTSLVSALQPFSESNLPHQHLDQISPLPQRALITADVSGEKDMKKYLDQVDPQDFCSGAADFFHLFLQKYFKPSHQAIEQKTVMDQFHYHIIINGSTVTDQEATQAFKQHEIPVLSIPGSWQDTTFVLGKKEESDWQQQVLEQLKQRHLVSIQIDHPVVFSREISDRFLQYLTRLSLFLRERITEKTRFWLTGGETAAAILNSWQVPGLEIDQQDTSGNVNLKIPKQTQYLFTVKPGSYPWTGQLYEIIKQVSYDK